MKKIILLVISALMVCISCKQEELLPIPVKSVKLNYTSLSMEVGDTEQLVATVLPKDADNKDVSWVSTEPAIANIDDNGRITAVSKGKAAIYVQTHDGGFKATCDVTVEPKVIKVSGVKLDKTSLSMTVGGKETLVAVVSPADATNTKVTWKSSATSVASVSDGVITAHSNGSAKISATTEDGNYTAECDVTVNEAGTPSWGICGTINDWGGNGTDIAMSEEISDKYYVATKVTLPAGSEFKFRYNNSWDDNYGSSVEKASVVINQKHDISSYGHNIIIANDGVYDIYLSRSFDHCYIMAEGKTPDNSGNDSGNNDSASNSWGLAGTFNNWGGDGKDMVMSEGIVSGYYVIKSVQLTTDMEFKFRYNNDWAVNYGGPENVSSYTPDTKYAAIAEGKNIVVSKDGTYDLYLSKNLDAFYIMSKGKTPNDSSNDSGNGSGNDSGNDSGEDSGEGNSGETHSWGIVGTVNKWGEAGEKDLRMQMSAYENYYVIKGINLTTASEFKFRYNNDWNYNYGGESGISTFSPNTQYTVISNGENIKISQNGTYDIYFSNTYGKFYISDKDKAPEFNTTAVTGVTLDYTNLTLEEGNTFKLEYSIKPANASDKSVTWQSSNTSVASVDKYGIVSAHVEGTAVITIITNDGGHTAECNVTVKKEAIEDMIVLNSSSINHISADANDYLISFISAKAWAATSDSEWLSINPMSGSFDDTSINVSVAKNTSKDQRNGTVTITSGKASVTISYFQEGAANDGGNGGNGDNYGNANPNDYSKISIKYNLNQTEVWEGSDSEWEDILNKTFSSSNTYGYGADFDRIEYKNGWITLCFNGNVTTIPAGVPYAGLAEVIVLPNSVTRIEGHAFYNSKALSINIPESLQEIGDEAFAYANGLKEVVLPKNLTTIGQAAFFGCPNLVSVEFPSSLTTIKSQAFSKCNKLSKVYVPSTIQEIEFGAFQECTILREVTIGNNTKVATMMIGENAFQNCSLLTDLTINSEVKNIGINAFNACNNLKNVTLGKNKSNSSMNIAREAFSKCVSLQNLTLGSEVNEIGKEAFISCTSLQSLTIPGTVSSIGESAFKNCISLAELIIGDDDMSHGTIIYKNAFIGCSGLRNTTLNKSVILNTLNEDHYYSRTSEFIFEDATGNIHINCEITDHKDNSKGVDYVFSRAKFNKITFGENVTKIGKRCFAEMQFGCLEISDNITEIEENAFSESTGNEIIFTKNSKLNKIGDGAFSSFKLNNRFDMPESLTIIGDEAFSYSTFTHMTIAPNIQEMGERPFYHTECDVTIKCDLSNSNFKYSFDGSWFSSIRIIANYDKINVLITGDAHTEIHGKSADQIIVEGSVKDISNVFIAYTSINELHICSSVVNMGQFVMLGQAINKVYCAATTPPSFDIWYNHKPFETTTIYVPRDSVSKYETAEGWKKWGYNFVGYDF